MSAARAHSIDLHLFFFLKAVFNNLIKFSFLFKTRNYKTLKLFFVSRTRSLLDPLTSKRHQSLADSENVYSFIFFDKCPECKHQFTKFILLILQANFGGRLNWGRIIYFGASPEDNWIRNRNGKLSALLLKWCNIQVIYVIKSCDDWRIEIEHVVASGWSISGD